MLPIEFDVEALRLEYIKFRILRRYPDLDQSATLHVLLQTLKKKIKNDKRV